MSKKNIRKINRSGTQTCPICERQAKLVCHHIHGREVPRWDERWNWAHVCSNCHDDIHAGDIIIEGNYRGTLIWHKKGEESITGNDALPHTYIVTS